MHAPRFWQSGGWPAVLLSPLESLTARITARRVARPGWTAPIPVICAGNAAVGGSGKTPLVLDILARLRRRGIDAHALTRGYGGTANVGDVGGVLRVDLAQHDAATTGDEALLLAAIAPCWAGADRAATARAAIAAGAQALVMDDGLQNPSLTKTCSILVIDGPAGFGNGRLLPAGPLREPVSAAAARCAVAVTIGPAAARSAAARAAATLPPALPILTAAIVPGPAMRALAGQTAVAFAGIGRPDKFFNTLREAGIILAAEAGFPDHHLYTRRDLDRLRRMAAAAGAALVTTTKDYVRIEPALRSGIVPLAATLAWEDEAAFEALLRGAVP